MPISIKTYIRAVWLFTPFVLLCSPQVVAAVCVFSDYSVRDEFERSFAVAIGTVVSERATPESKDLYEGVTYTIDVEESFRGRVPATIELFSENSSGRFPMTKGEKYVLFLYQLADRLAVDNCGNSGPVAENQDVFTAVRQLAKVAHELQKPN
ncbi:MAG: hypothetical protein L0H94_14440 [Nitrospira sp.]|nr:hypothetical protein [Nitrospira sp.]